MVQFEHSFSALLLICFLLKDNISLLNSVSIRQFLASICAKAFIFSSVIIGAGLFLYSGVGSIY